jgi:hypothetical protein
VFVLPLTRAICFRAVLEKGKRFQVPRVVRWEFKLESSQVLRVTVDVVGSYGQGESFFGRMNADGRITVPKLTFDLLQGRNEDVGSLLGQVMDVRLEPASG